MDVRSSLYKAVVLSGGSSMYPGLPSRLGEGAEAVVVDEGFGWESREVECACFPLLSSFNPLVLTAWNDACRNSR